ncbi:hypothetical protein JCM8547_008750 [Rhodosporidiobolus lusitaniae]
MSLLDWGSSVGNRLFGPDPKLEFRKPGQGVDLLTGPPISIDEPYWNQYLTLFDTPSDLPLLLPTPILLQTLQSSPENLLTLVTFLSLTLFRFLATPGFPRPGKEDAKQALCAVRVLSRIVPLLLGPQGVDAQGRRRRDEVEEWLFWRREKAEGEEKPAEEGGKVQENGQAAAEGDGQFVLEDDEEDEDVESAKPSDPLTSSSSSAAPSAPSPSKERFSPPLAERLISALVDLLFVPGLTLPETLRQGPDATVTYAIWEPGIASPPPSTPPPPTVHSLLLNRLTILRLLTLLVSLPSLLTPPGLFPTLPNRWRDALVSADALKKDGAEGEEDNSKNVVLCLLCSVVNTAFAPPPSQSSLFLSSGGGEGLRERAARLAQDAARKGASAAGAGPVGGGEENEDPEVTKQALRGACLQLLSVVLVEHAPPETAAGDSASAGERAGEPSPFVPQEATMSSSSSSSAEPPPAPPANLFTFYLSRLHRSSDLSFLLSGLLTHLTTALSPAPSSLLSLPLPISLTGAPVQQRAKDPGLANEALVVLWRLVETNRKFVGWVVKPEVGEGKEGKGGEGRSRLVSLVVAVEGVIGEWKGDEAQLSLLRLSTFLLQTLTSLIASASHPGTPASHALAGLLSAPLSADLVGDRLWAVVKRQCESQGTVVEDEGQVEGARGVTAVEFVVITLHSLLLPSSSPSSPPPSATHRAALSALYPPLLLTLSNLSPYIRELSSDASTRLVRVWLAFSAPSWVLMEEGNPRLVYYLLETFDHILLSNLDSNPSLIHALLLTKKRLDLLSDFTLAVGVSEARRLRAARRARQTGGGRGGSNLGAIPEGSAAEPASPSLGDGGGASEKALGKRRERTLSTSSLGGFSVADLSLSPSPVASPALPGEDAPRQSLDMGAGGGGGDERPFVGKNGFTPTEEWVRSWKDGLPLAPLLTLLSTLSSSLSSPLPSTPSSHSLSTLRSILLTPSLTSSLSPSLSSIPPHRPRPFLPSPASTTWLASTAFGRVYLAQFEVLRDIVPVQLFAVAQAPGAGGGGRGGVVGGLSEGLGRELERAGKTAVDLVGGRVGGLARGLFGGR